MKTASPAHQAKVDLLVRAFCDGCRPDDTPRPPAPPKDEVSAWMLRVFRAALHRQEAEAELVRELAAFTVPDEI